MEPRHGDAGSLALGKLSRIAGPDTEEESRNAVRVLRQVEEAEVFTGHFSVPIHDAAVSKGGDEDSFESRSQCRVIIRDRRCFSLTHRHDGHPVRRKAVGCGHVQRHLLQRINNLVAYGIAEGARGELELHFVGNDVALDPATNRAHRDNSWLLWRNLPTDDGLDIENVFGGHHDGVFGAARATTHLSVSAVQHTFRLSEAMPPEDARK